MAKRLNVKKTTPTEVCSKWNISQYPIQWNYGIYVRCNYKGEINWDKTFIYTINELIERDNVRIL